MDETTNTTETTQEETTAQQSADTATPAGDTGAAETQAAAGEQKTDAADPPAGKVYTDAQLEELRAQWRKEDELAQVAQKDFEKMTPEEQARKLLADQKTEADRLKAELADRDLTDYARGEIAKAELPAEALAFVKGKDQDDTDARVKSFKELLAAGVQAGVEKRFKDNGYTPRGSAASNADASGKKPRGVSINPGK